MILFGSDNIQTQYNLVNKRVVDDILARVSKGMPFNLLFSVINLIILCTLLCHGKNTSIHNATNNSNDETSSISTLPEPRRRPKLSWTLRKPKRQCFANAKYQNDRATHPIYVEFETTLSECKVRCETSTDANNRQCVAIEWGDSGHAKTSRGTEILRCGLAFGCTRLKLWKGGSVYVLESYIENVRDDATSVLPFVIIIQCIIGCFVSCVVCSGIQKVRDNYYGRTPGNRNSNRRGSDSTRVASSNVPHMNTRNTYEIALVMNTSSLRKNSNKVMDENMDSDNATGKNHKIAKTDIDIKIDGEDIYHYEKDNENGGIRLTMHLQDKCYICMEPCYTCSTCICHIPAHESCMSKMLQKKECSVCKTLFGSGLVVAPVVEEEGKK